MDWCFDAWCDRFEARKKKVLFCRAGKVRKKKEKEGAKWNQ